jgi:hypothetical protein
VSCNYCIEAHKDPMYPAYDIGCFECMARRLAIRMKRGEVDQKHADLAMEGFFGQRLDEAKQEMRFWQERLR